MHICLEKGYFLIWKYVHKSIYLRIAYCYVTLIGKVIKVVKFDNDWDEVLKDEFEKEYYKKIRAFLKSEYMNYTIYPDMYDIFNALKATPLKNLKAVILGQDPYPGEGQAHGMCFSVKPKVAIPPSLQNIFQELKNDVGFKIPDHGCLIEWAMQGVLLLNTVLTVRAGSPNSHKNIGWEIFTDRIIQIINSQKQNVVFFLWGNNAKTKKALIDPYKHYILEAAHPSPLSAYAGFFGCRHFSKANQYLISHGIEPINWQITDIKDNPYIIKYM